MYIRDKIHWFVAGLFAGIMLAGSTPMAVVENIEGYLRDGKYRYREWKREREIKNRQNP